MKDYTLRNKKNYILSEKQNEIVEALLANDFFFNCAQTGFGKTFTTITAAIHKIVERKEDDIHFVLMLPQRAVKAFRDTIKGLLGLSYSIYSARMTRVSKTARFHIFNYSTIGSNILTKDSVVLGTNFYYETLQKLAKEHKNLWLIADEVHSLQDPNTTQYQMMSSIMPLFIGAWGLTASPILNNIDGVYYMTQLFKPGYLGSNIYAFRHKFCTFEKVEFWKTIRGKPQKKTVEELNGYKNLDVLKDLLGRISIVRSKEYDIRFNYLSTELSKTSLKYYHYASAGLFSSKILKSGKVKKSKQNHAGARLHDLQRVVSNSHTQFKMIKNPDLLTEKELLLINTVKDVINKDEAVLIYFGYHETIDRIRYIFQKLKDRLNIPDIHEITGKINYEKRKKVEDAIKPRDIVLITSAGTESINLQKANNIIFYEIPFSIREFIQACGRITRTNSEFSQFNVYILEASGTIDTYKKNRIFSNMALVKSLLGHNNTLPVEYLVLSNEDKKFMKDELLWCK